MADAESPRRPLAPGSMTEEVSLAEAVRTALEMADLFANLRAAAAR